MALELSTVLDLRFLRIPYPQCAICRPRCYEMACRVPGNGPYAIKNVQIDMTFGDLGSGCVRMRPRASRCWIVIRLSL